MTDIEVAPVTAVIPTYEREGMLAEAIRSIREQTLPVAELIVVDERIGTCRFG